MGALVREFGNVKALVDDSVAGSELRLGSINTALHRLMPDVLAGLVKRFPQMRVHILQAAFGVMHRAASIPVYRDMSGRHAVPL